MKIKQILVAATLCLSTCFLPLACSGDPGQTTSTVTSGVSSSSSSSGEGGTGGMDAGKCSTCQDCVNSGCEKDMACTSEEYDKFYAVKECSQNQINNCPDCSLNFNGPISDACLQCASENTPNPQCHLSCEPCGKYDVLATCELCSKVGCEFNKPLPGQCYGGVVFYTDIIGCLQDNAVQQNCPACQGITDKMPIDPACVGCAKKYVNPTCRLSCESMLP